MVAVPLALALVTLSVCRAGPSAGGDPAFEAPQGADALPVRLRFTGTQVVVEHVGEGLLQDVRIQVARGRDGPYRYRADAILGGRSVTVGALNFEKDGGARLSPFAGPPREWAVTAVLPDGRTGYATGRFE